MDNEEALNALASLVPESIVPSSVSAKPAYDEAVANVEAEIRSWPEERRIVFQGAGEERFSTAISLREVHNTTICLVGAGGLGNWIWRVLVGMGFTKLVVFDDDTVEQENIGSQAHNIVDLHIPKVEAVRRNAMLFRGISVRACNKRVSTLKEIYDELGFMPEVIIGATDSTEFRNSFIEDFHDCVCYGYGRGMLPSDGMPDLFVDLRMALGDWNCYLLPVKNLHEAEHGRYRHMKKYMASAVFPPEQAVQEPCTARAITYTGANVASYVGAVLHWWVNAGKQATKDADYLEKVFFANCKAPGEFGWLYTFSSRDWDSVTWSRRFTNMVEKEKQQERKLDFLKKLLFSQGFTITDGVKFMFPEEMEDCLNKCDLRGTIISVSGKLWFRSLRNEWVELDMDSGETHVADQMDILRYADTFCAYKVSPMTDMIDNWWGFVNMDNVETKLSIGLCRFKEIARDVATVRIIVFNNKERKILHCYKPDNDVMVGFPEVISWAANGAKVKEVSIQECINSMLGMHGKLESFYEFYQIDDDYTWHYLANTGVDTYFDRFQDEINSTVLGIVTGGDKVNLANLGNGDYFLMNGKKYYVELDEGYRKRVVEEGNTGNTFWMNVKNRDGALVRVAV